MNKKFLKLIIVTILSSSILSLSIPAYAEEISENATKEISETENLTYSDDEEIVDIPDENLKRAINIQLGKSEDSNLTKGELKLITSLDISNSNIKSLKGLEYCGNLISLNISHNNIIDISPLENLSNIVDLNLSYNQITDITPLKEFKNLISIDTTANAPIVESFKILSFSALSLLDKMASHTSIKPSKCNIPVIIKGTIITIALLSINEQLKSVIK